MSLPPPMGVPLDSTLNEVLQKVGEAARCCVLSGIFGRVLHAARVCAKRRCWFGVDGSTHSACSCFPAVLAGLLHAACV
jgi:hypothetical protein